MSEQASPIRDLPQIRRWDAVPPDAAAAAVDLVEDGKVLWLSQLGFDLSAAERRFLTPDVSDGKAKNVSFDPTARTVSGTRLQGSDRAALVAMLGRFAAQARMLVDGLFPAYRHALETRLVSFRPVAVAGRKASPKKDDMRLHVDAFASRPNRGRRILRVFTNLNPKGEPRIWNVGEPFEAFAPRFIPRIPRYSRSAARLLERARITKSRRSEYDHIMLKLHDLGKLDMRYQADSPQTRFAFPPSTTWICYSDQVLHATLGGQFMMEQTYFLPVEGMVHPERSPLRILERDYGHALT